MYKVFCFAVHLAGFRTSFISDDTLVFLSLCFLLFQIMAYISHSVIKYLYSVQFVYFNLSMYYYKNHLCYDLTKDLTTDFTKWITLRRSAKYTVTQECPISQLRRVNAPLRSLLVDIILCALQYYKFTCQQVVENRRKNRMILRVESSVISKV